MLIVYRYLGAFDITLAQYKMRQLRSKLGDALNVLELVTEATEYIMATVAMLPENTRDFMTGFNQATSQGSDYWKAALTRNSGSPPVAALVLCLPGIQA